MGEGRSHNNPSTHFIYRVVDLDLDLTLCVGYGSPGRLRSHRAKLFSTYGASENVAIDIICYSSSRRESLILESVAIAALKPVLNKTKYGGLLGVQIWNKGGQLSEDHKKKLRTIQSSRRVRKPHTEETKLKISLANKGKTGIKGVVRTDAHRKAISLAKMGKKIGPHTLARRQAISQGIQNYLRSKVPPP